MMKQCVHGLILCATFCIGDYAPIAQLGAVENVGAGVESIDGVESTAAISIQLPRKSDLANLSDLVAKFANVSLKYDPNKLRGSVTLNIQKKLNPQALWDVYNQVLTSQQYATVVTGTPAVYHVVPLNEAAMLSAMLTQKQLATLTFKPSYMVVVHDLQFLPAETAVKSVSSLLFSNTIAQVRAFGQDKKRIVIAGVSAMVHQAIAILTRIDVAGIRPIIRSFKPQFATPHSLQTAATAAWAALNRLTPGAFVGELQLTPDKTHLLLIASTETIGELETLLKDLDRAEPQSSLTYTPRYFTMDDVADLIEQIFAQEDQNIKKPAIIRDTLTNTIIIHATAGQHQRIHTLMERLNNIPAEGKEKMRTFVIKHRQASELVSVLSSLLSDDTQNNVQTNAAHTVNTANSNAPAINNNTNTAINSTTNNSGNNNNNTPMATHDNTPNTNTDSTTNAQALLNVSSGPTVRLSTDDHTNSIIAISTPQQLAHVEKLIAQLDQRQAQVQLEVIMVNISDKESRDLGVALTHQFEQNGTTTNLSSVFGLSQALDASPGTATLPDSFAGLAGTVINPGNFAGIIRALETVTEGTSIVRSTIVVNNNEQADVDSVREEPITNFNAGDRFSTTTFSGTLDAGTKISITPHVSAAGYVTLSYEISQSAFIGESTVTADGGTVPPPKRKDSLTSVATIPDGHIIAVGGLVDDEESESVSKIPLLGSIPGLGVFFRSTTSSIDRSTFYVFIRVNILNNKNFETLRHRSKKQLGEAQMTDDEWPQLKARFIR